MGRKFLSDLLERGNMQSSTPYPTLIETWLPFEELGAESRRERGASSALPPLYFLHVWWARRPLTASRAAVLASVLPAWSPDWPEPLREQFPDEDSYRAWFLRLIGILGDPVAANRMLQQARASGSRISNPYGYPRAFTVNPAADDLAILGDLLQFAWGQKDLTVLDPFAGGGSIPFEALRYGFTTIANELNPVAAVILKATLDYPARFGPELAQDIRTWGQRWYERARERLKPFFTPLPPNAEGAAYLWARMVACPKTGKPVPLSPNWWLRKGDNPVAVRLIAEPGMDSPRFEILQGKAALAANPDEGTVRRGDGRSPWTGAVIPGDYIKQEAQAGRMGQTLYAVALKKPGGFEFRPPTPEDLQAAARAEEELARLRPRWEAEDVIPTEIIPDGLKTSEPHRYGMRTWADMFSPRQLLALGTFVETLRELRPEMLAELGRERAEAVEVYLAFALDKALDRNSYQTRWIPQRNVIANTFDRHDFAMKWSFAEFDSSANLLPWAINQISDAFSDLAGMSAPSQSSFLGASGGPSMGRITIIQGDAADIRAIDADSVHNITVDPPYYDNVMYAELSDFFYVWQKRAIGHLFPGFFRAQLTDKDAEAVANDSVAFCV
jgi:adenine-specific DNA methylase